MPIHARPKPNTLPDATPAVSWAFFCRPEHPQKTLEFRISSRQPSLRAGETNFRITVLNITQPSSSPHCPIAACWFAWVRHRNYRSANQYIQHAHDCLQCGAEIMRLAQFSAPSPLCGVLLSVLFHLAVMRNELGRIGGFKPDTFEAWKSFSQSLKTHIDQCPSQCLKAVREFVDFTHGFPVPEPVGKHWIVEASQDLVVGFLFTLFAPTLYQNAKHWLNDEEERR